MPGQIKNMIDSIIKQRAKGNSTIEMTTKAKLHLKGINVDQFTPNSPDDPVVVTKLLDIAKELSVTL
jgi:hypothetical protein